MPDDPTPAAEPAATAAVTPSDPPDPAPEKTFTQADLDRHIADRLNRQRAQFSDYDDMKRKAAEYDKLEAANKTELEKAQERAAQLEKQAAEAAARAHENALKAAVISEAAKRNVVDPDAAFALIDRTSLQTGDDGTLSGLAEAMDALLTAKPYLVSAAGPTPSADLGARRRSGVEQITREALKSMSQAEIIQAQNEGRLDTVLGRTP